MEIFISVNVMTNKFLSFIQLAIIAVLCAPSTFAAAAATGNADRVSVPLSDPTRPAFIKAHLLNGAITVEGYEGKEVVLEARARASEEIDQESIGMRSLNIDSTGLDYEVKKHRIN